MSEFIPESDMERLFVQTMEWPVGRLWRRAMHSAGRGQWAHAAAYTLSLALAYAENLPASNASIETVDSLESLLPSLNPDQRYSLFKITCVAIEKLRSHDFDFRSGVVRALRQILHSIFFSRGKVRAAHVDMMRQLNELYGGDHWCVEFFQQTPTPIEDLTGTLPDLILEETAGVLPSSSRQQQLHNWRDRTGAHLPSLQHLQSAYIESVGIVIRNVLIDHEAQATSLVLRYDSKPNAVRIVTVAPKLPGAAAGFLPDDIVVSVNSVDVDSIDAMLFEMKKFVPGEVVTFQVLRVAELLTIRVRVQGTAGASGHIFPRERMTFRTRLTKYQDELIDATTKYGIKSPEATHALIKLADLTHAHNAVAQNVYLMELVGILSDESVKVSQYYLRKVYYLTGRLKTDPEYARIANELQQTVFVRRAREIGHDMGMTLPLARLIHYWYRSKRLTDGERLCDELLNWAKKNSTSEDVTYRQIKSALAKIQELKSSETEELKSSGIEELKNSETEEQKISEMTLSADAGLDRESWQEVDEFISMLATVALDYQCHGDDAKAELVMNEAIAYYRDSDSEVARRIGEMLWLLMETDLREYRSFRENLIAATIAGAFDQHLKLRLFAHLKRLLGMIQKKEAASELLEFVLQQDDRTNTSLGQVMYQRLKHDSLRDQTQYLRRDSSPVAVMAAEEEFRQLIEQPQLSKVKLITANDLGEQLADHYRWNGEFKRAVEVLKALLAQPAQSKAQVMKLLTRLGQVHVASENICEATAMLYMAFNIPDSEDFDPASEPLILPKGA